ncbi:sulfate transporter-like [Tropilaelaps mercedesae]|uniref:Sulfate transporter-like n=1 Tax=Tropilaelaps mercedesae TaxID=418985 RepID=A0A1V9Y2B9_9ACAR|nr:sulfate transporter-like [Tropilaelaps mercedesae]
MENKGFINNSSDTSELANDKENQRPSNAFRKKSGVRIHITAEDLFVKNNADRKNQSLLSTACSRFHPLRLLPALGWLSRYHLPHLKEDFIAAITVAIMHVPQGLAYGELAGVSSIQGLYVSTFPPLIYALLGTTRHVSIGKIILLLGFKSDFYYQTLRVTNIHILLRSTNNIFLSTNCMNKSAA